MALDMKECEMSALMLPVSERAALAERLIESLDSLDDAETERLWVEEAERRYQAYKQGRLSARPAAEAIQNAQARLR
jgi:putative addiction module component (TIGR02574 family)